MLCDFACCLIWTYHIWRDGAFFVWDCCWSQKVNTWTPSIVFLSQRGAWKGLCCVSLQVMLLPPSSCHCFQTWLSSFPERNPNPASWWRQIFDRLLYIFPAKINTKTYIAFNYDTSFYHILSHKDRTGRFIP